MSLGLHRFVSLCTSTAVVPSSPHIRNGRDQPSPGLCRQRARGAEDEEGMIREIRALTGLVMVEIKRSDWNKELEDEIAEIRQIATVTFHWSRSSFYMPCLC